MGASTDAVPPDVSAVTVTDTGMLALRSAATLVDVLPRVRVQINDGDRVLLTVSRTVVPQKEGGMVVSPCSLRSAVGHAYHRMCCHGVQFQFLDLPDHSEPSIHVGLPAGDLVLPGFIYRVRAANDHYLFLFMSDMGPGDCHEAVAGTVDAATDSDPIGFRRRVGFHHDNLTDLTVVHTLAAQRDRYAAAQLMERLLGICVTADMVSDLQRVPPPSQDTAK